MARLRWILLVVTLAVAGGCGSGGNVPRGEPLDRLHEQARAALARYDQAFNEAGGAQGFVPVGELTSQVGGWELTNGDNKLALMTGLVVAAVTLPAPPEPTGEVVWETGTRKTLPLISADEALRQLRASAGECQGCPAIAPLEATGARLITARIQTTRGPATAPAWEYTLKGTAVRITRVAVSSSAMVKVTPPSWDPYNAPGGLPIESATTDVDGLQLTVAFTGSPDPGSKPCGADYTGEAVESVNAVVIIVTTHPHAPGENCAGIGARRTAIVELAQPLGERAVLEVQQGLPVPVSITM